VALDENLSEKQLQHLSKQYIYTLINAIASAAATSICPLESGKQHARGTRESAAGCLLDEGAANKYEVEFEKER
jgi:hypothetical protein